METISEAYKSELEQWYKIYAEGCREANLHRTHPALTVLEQDDLDYSSLRRETKYASRLILLKDGFCHACGNALENWPILPDRLGDNVVLPSFATVDVTAGARAGCKFCGLILTRLHVSQQLDIFRKIERRLSLLKINQKSVLMLATWAGDAQLRTLSYPGIEAKINSLHSCTLATFGSRPGLRHILSIA